MNNCLQLSFVLKVSDSVTVSDSVAWFLYFQYAVTKHYSFNGVPVAVRTGGNEPTLLYQDGVGSTVYTTNVWGSVTSARGYTAFGATRFSEGTMPTDRHFTSQREDGTGLYYYGAR